MKRTGHLTLGSAAFLAGCAWVSLASLEWYLGQGYVIGQTAALPLVARFYAFEGVAIGLALFGAWHILKGLAIWNPERQDSAFAVLSATLSDRRDVKVGIVAGGVYGVAYLFLSSVIVYQPTVAFPQTGLFAGVCCGPPGTVPELIVVLSQQLHLGVQLLPLDVLFALVIPVFVGFNASVAVHALRYRSRIPRSGWLGVFGVAAGLFTGCPTCAGVFLAEAIGGAGAATMAVALAPYQLLFIVLTIPVLLSSPFIMAAYAARAQACRVPASVTPD